MMPWQQIAPAAGLGNANATAKIKQLNQELAALRAEMADKDMRIQKMNADKIQQDAAEMNFRELALNQAMTRRQVIAQREEIIAQADEDFLNRMPFQHEPNTL
jgi:GTPase involved in cell partitioning and DNA repair